MQNTIICVVLTLCTFSSCITIHVPPSTIANTDPPQQPNNTAIYTPTPPPDGQTGRIVYHGTNNTIRRLVNEANAVMEKPQFYPAIGAKGDFTYTAETSGDIMRAMQAFTGTVRVRLYSNAASNANAYFSSAYPNTIFINEAKLERSHSSIVNTMVHELVHAVDRSRPDLRFGHGDNRRAGKEDSAPYWIGKLAQCLHSSNQVCAPGAKGLDEDFIFIELDGIDEDWIID